MKKIILASILFLLYTKGYNQVTNIPDSNFEAYLETHTASGTSVSVGDPNSMGNGIANDNLVTTANIENVTHLDVHSLNIANLSGIEDFTALTNLNVNRNQLTGIDLSANLALTRLDIDFNQLTSLDLSNNTLLYILNAGNNQLSNIDLSHNTNLVHVALTYNMLSSIDLSQNTQLNYILLYNNQLTSLDVSQNTLLETFNVRHNQLTDLNVQNGNNAIINYFEAAVNPNLTCIQVDDPNASYLSNWHKDSTAQFSDDCSVSYYDLNVTTTGNGSVTLNPTGGNYPEGTTITLNAIPDTGWVFSGWTGDLSGNANPTTMTMDSDKTVTATFTQIQYTLDVSIYGNGSVTLSPTGGVYNAGTVVTVTATPDSGWQFDGWDGSVNTSSNPVTVTMDSNKSIVASFSHIQYLLTTNTNGNGNITINPTGGTYNEGTNVTLTATPDAGWTFTSWSGDISGTNNPASIIMDSDKTVTAIFEETTPDYCYSYGNTQYLTSITSVLFNTINNQSGKETDVQGNAYADFTSLSTNVHREGVYDLNIQVNTAGSYTVKTTVWIDWNQDLDFDDTGETYDLGTAINVSNGLTSLSPLSITVPTNALLGNTRMRVATKFNSYSTSCEQGFDGEVEDYTLIIQEAVNITDYYKKLIMVYPNPVVNNLHIEYQKGKKINVYIFDMLGQKLLHKSANNGIINLNIQGLPATNYLIKVVTDNHQTHYNIIKQ